MLQLFRFAASASALLMIFNSKTLGRRSWYKWCFYKALSGQVVAYFTNLFLYNILLSLFDSLDMTICEAGYFSGTCKQV